MIKQVKKRQIKPTSVIMAIIALCLVIYIGMKSSGLGVLLSGNTILKDTKEIIELSAKENEYVGINGEQVIKVNRDGIVAYDLDGYELWSDTFSMSNLVVRQREPYIAVGGKGGKSLILFNNKGRQTEISCDYPIVYFSVNESGGIAVIQSLGDGHMICAYDSNGKAISGRRTTYTKTEGYPTTVELSPDNRYLMASYIKVDEPVLTSTIIGIDTTQKSSEELDEVKYGIAQKGNLVYEIEFITNDEWVTVGDTRTTWYDLSGAELNSINNLSSVFTPYLHKRASYGQGFFPMITTVSSNKNIVHRTDTLTYFNGMGETQFTTQLAATNYFYADSKGVVVGSGNDFIGYSKLGKQLFEYHSQIDVTKLFYLPEKRKGIAVTREKVILLSAKRKGEE